MTGLAVGDILTVLAACCYVAARWADRMSS
jgi:hypothetical protein